MKTRNQKGILIIIILLLIVVVFGIYKLFDLNFNNSINLSLSEKNWIEDNKNNVIDIAILNNLPVFSKDGEGIYFSFLQYFQDNTELDFNKISYTSKDDIPDTQYIFKVLDSNSVIDDNNLLFYEDNYVILSRNSKKIKNLDNIGKVNIGVLLSEVEVISSYLNNNNITYISVSDINKLIDSFNNDEFNYIVIPKNIYLSTIIENNYYIANFLNGLSKKYVLNLNKDSDRLNSILTKYYTFWIRNFLVEHYNNELFNLYCVIKDINNSEKSSFRSKRYIYGYVDNLPYETNKKDVFVGINSEFLNGFSNFANIEFSYQKYDSVTTLNQAVAKGKVDLIFNYYQFEDIAEKVNTTINSFYGDYVILNHITNDVVVNSLNGLKDNNISALNNTKLINYIEQNTNANINKVDNIKKLIKNKNNLVLIDYNTYDFYKSNIFKNYNIVYKNTADINYNYLVYNNETNNLFYNIYQFYLSGINHEEYRNIGMNNIMINYNKLDWLWLWPYIVLIVILFIIVVIILNKRNKVIKKDDKTKYIDLLTSLKNRYYLSLNLKKWEENKIYPQAVVIIDLNNLKDINDSYGHDEGDHLIKTAANILINNQLSNTDIIRTDGNEFMIYMIGYNENEVISYIKKLNKLLKDLPYEYGASIGYSMIEDDIKMIDDAINEAVLDMITNKETNKNNN